MPITQEDPTTQAPAATPPAVPSTVQLDPASVDAIVQSLQAGSRSSGAQEPVSQFQQAIAELKANPESNDLDTLNTIEGLFRAHTHDLSRAQQAEINKVIQAERIAAGNKALRAEINRVIEADEDLKRYADAVEVLVGKDFSTDPSLENERRKLLAEGVDENVIRKLVNKHFNALAGDTKKKPNSVSGMTSTEGVNAAAAAQVTKAQAVSVGDLNERQRDLFYAIVSEYDKVGHKSHGKTKDEVEQDAFKRASSKFLKK